MYARMNGTVIVTCARSGRTISGSPAELLDHAEDVVPAPGVQPRRVLAQLVQDLVHLERREDRLDQDGRADGSARDAEPLLGPDEHVVPQPRLEMALELREIEVRSGPAFELLSRVVEEREAEVEQAARHGPIVHRQVAFGKVPAARPNQQRRGLVREPVLASVGTRHLDRPADRVGEVDLSLDHVRPGRSVRVLEVGHEAARTAVQRVDHHLAIGGAGDLDPAVSQVRGRGRDPPLRVPHVAGRFEEVRSLALVEPDLAFDTCLEQLDPARAELTLEPRHERERLPGQDLVEPGLHRTEDLDAVGMRHGPSPTRSRAARLGTGLPAPGPRPGRPLRTTPRAAGTGAGPMIVAGSSSTPSEAAPARQAPTRAVASSRCGSSQPYTAAYRLTRCEGCRSHPW